jgi:hypothetical protein
MPPKRNPSSSASITSPDFAEQLAELTSIIKSYAARFNKLEKLLTDTRKENSALRTALSVKETETRKLQEKLNDQEQYVRGWSIRILNLQIPADEATQPELVMAHLQRGPGQEADPLHPLPPQHHGDCPHPPRQEGCNQSHHRQVLYKKHQKHAIPPET